jgi:hypothetical protein
MLSGFGLGSKAWRQSRLDGPLNGCAASYVAGYSQSGQSCRVDFIFSSFRRSFLRSGSGVGKLFDDYRSRNRRRQNKHRPLGSGGRAGSPSVSSLAKSQLTRRPSLHLCIRAAEGRSGMDGQHRGGHRDSKTRGAGLYGGSEEKKLFCRTKGIVAALFQSCASRCDHHAVQSRPATYQKFFARILRSDPLSLVD